LPQEFSLVIGGPLYQLYRKTRLLRGPMELVVRRILAIPLICWLPLLVLTAAAGHLIGGVPVPFLRDPEVHIKLLLALPILIAAEVLVHDRIRLVVGQFEQRDIIARQDQQHFRELVASAMRLRNSVRVELGLFALVLMIGYWMWQQNLKLTVSNISISSWYAISTSSGLHLTAAGMYYAFVSLSIFRFLLLRWYFRLFIWYRFLWQVRAMPLQLNLYHPDRAGGLGFLSASLIAFSPIFVAQTTVLSSVVFTRILHGGKTLPDFTMELVVAVLFFVLVAVLPMAFFITKLERAGRFARFELGALASHYVDDFRQKWVKGSSRPAEPLLGTGDIQSLADMANSFEVVSGVGLFPINKKSLIRLVGAIVVPLLPLTLTVIPLSEIVKSLIKIVF